MSASRARTRTTRLAAILLAATALAALLPAGALAAAPALRVRAEPEHGYAVIHGAGGPEGIVLLEERPAGLFVGIGMTGVAFRAVSLYGATAPCDFVGFSTVRLGTFHPVKGRFAAGYIAGAADAVDTIASVRLMAGNHLVACRTLVWGDRDGVSCDIDPEQEDCPRPEYVVPAAGEFGALMKAGLLLIAFEKPNGRSVAAIVGLRKLPYRLAFGDASCADGGGTTLASTGIFPGVGMRRVGIAVGKTMLFVNSIRVLTPNGTGTCVDVALFQRVPLAG